MSSALILLFGVWFNPAQVVSLSENNSLVSPVKCYINISNTGEFGQFVIPSNEDCRETARMINEASFLSKK